MQQNHFHHLVGRTGRIKQKFAFVGSWLEDPQGWQCVWREKFVELLGDWPADAELSPQWELLEQRDRYDLHRVTYQTEPGLGAFAYVAIPRGKSGPWPAVLALHGHGLLGAEPVMAAGGDACLEEEIKKYEYDFGRRMAEQGMVVFAPNLRGFGERLSDVERNSPRDSCNVNFFQQMLLGEVAITSQLHDLKVAIDLISSMPQVNASAIGCAGLSYGGRLTMCLAAIDLRIKSVVISGALNSFAERIASYGGCGYQVIPGLLRYGDVGEVMGLIAPRPLAIELGDQDAHCCPMPQAEELFSRVRGIYQALACKDKLKLFEFEGGHVFRGEHSIPWLIEQLKNTSQVNNKR